MSRLTSVFSMPLRRLGVTLIATIAVVLLTSAPALAHVDLESSTPSDGTRVATVPEMIELRFTSEAVPAGEGIVVADADGNTVDVSVTQPKPTLIHVVPSEPLPNGVYGVLWTMRAGDAHPRSGTFTFQVDAPVTTEVATLPSTPDTTGDTTAEGDEAQPDADPEIPTALAPSAPFDESTGRADGQIPESEAQAPTEVELDPLFDVASSDSSAGGVLGGIGRWVAMAGALVAIGAFAFAATSLLGAKREAEEAGYWLRRGGILIVVGTVAELLGASMALAGSALRGLSPSSIIATLSGSFGLAVLLRIVGGTIMLQGTTIVASEAESPIADSSRLPAPSRDRTGVAVLDRVSPAFRLDVHHERLALIGIGLVTASYMFDGHTVTTSPTLLVRAASATHVLAAGVWVGGVLIMALTLARRHRRGEDLGAAAMVIRFSPVASVALIAVAVAGVAMAVAILDTPTELLTTSWGRVLVMKLLAVGVAAGIGGYNHFVTVPALETNPADAPSADRLRRLVLVEGGILLAVVALTAVLVVAST